MSRVLTSESTGAAVYVFSEDHCPPHVHARHRGEGWIARVRFSYLGGVVALMSIAPLRNAPSQRMVNRLLADIADGLPILRRRWWMTNHTTCLANRMAIVSAAGRIELAPAHSGDAKQIGNAVYHPEEARLRVEFQDGTAMEVSTGP